MCTLGRGDLETLSNMCTRSQVIMIKRNAKAPFIEYRGGAAYPHSHIVGESN